MANKIRHKENTAFKNTENKQIFSFEIFSDLGTEPCVYIAQLLLRNKNFFNIIKHNKIYLSSLKYDKPSDAGPRFSFFFLTLAKTRTIIVTT